MSEEKVEALKKEGTWKGKHPWRNDKGIVIGRARVKSVEKKHKKPKGSQYNRSTTKKLVGFNWRIATKLCGEIANGMTVGQVLKKHKKDPGWPRSLRMLYKWLRAIPEFRAIFNQAQMDRAETFVEQLLETMEDVKKGKLTIAEARYISDQIKWTAEKFKPEKFGTAVPKDKDTDRITFEFNMVLDGGDKSEPKQIEGEETQAVLEAPYEEAYIVEDDEN